MNLLPGKMGLLIAVAVVVPLYAILTVIDVLAIDYVFDSNKTDYFKWPLLISTALSLVLCWAQIVWYVIDLFTRS